MLTKDGHGLNGVYSIVSAIISNLELLNLDQCYTFFLQNPFVSLRTLERQMKLLQKVRERQRNSTVCLL